MVPGCERLYQRLTFIPSGDAKRNDDCYIGIGHPKFSRWRKKPTAIVTNINALLNSALFAFDSSQRLSERTAPFDAVVYILDGEARLAIGGNPQSVAAGEMLVMPANVAHSLQAEVPFNMLLEMIRRAYNPLYGILLQHMV